MVASFGADFKPLALFLARENSQFSRSYRWFPAKVRQSNERKNSLLMTRLYSVLVNSASDWSYLLSLFLFRLVFCKEQLKEPTRVFGKGFSNSLIIHAVKGQ